MPLLEPAAKLQVRVRVRVRVKGYRVRVRVTKPKPNPNPDQHEIHEIEMALSALTRAPDRSTGHSFVIFNEEAA